MKKTWGIVVAIVIFLFSLLLFFLMINIFLQSVDVDSEKEKPILETRESSSGKETVVREDAVPQSFEARLEADPLTLLPSRVENLPRARALEEEKKIIKRVEKFLDRWETYSPLQEDNYSKRLTKHIDFDFSQSILDRKDSLDDIGVCREADCQIGTSWQEGGQGGFTIGDYNGEEAYVYGYGLVEYDPSATWDPRSGTLAYRSYGILLRKDEERWVVTRAAAETLTEISS